jgi:hypothetical protein
MAKFLTTVAGFQPNSLAVAAVEADSVNQQDANQDSQSEDTAHAVELNRKYL